MLLLQGGSRIEKGAADRSFAHAAKNYVTRLFNPPKCHILQHSPALRQYKGFIANGCNACELLWTVADGCDPQRNILSEHASGLHPQSRKVKQELLHAFGKSGNTLARVAPVFRQGSCQQGGMVPARLQTAKCSIPARFQQASRRILAKFPFRQGSDSVPARFQQGSSMVLEIPQTLLLSMACS